MKTAASKKISPSRPPLAPTSDPWLVRHGTQVLLATAALFAAVLLTTLVMSRLKKAEERGWERLSSSLSFSSQGRTEEALNALNGVLGDHRSGPVAVQAHLMKSSLLADEGKKEEALLSAREARRQAATPEYRALASAALAHALEESGKIEEASAEYALFLKDHPDHFLSPRIQFQWARLLAAQGKTDEARTAYEGLVTLHPATIWARDAKESLEALGAR